MKDIFLQHMNELITGILAVLLGWFGKGKIAKRQDNADLTGRIQAIYRDMITDTDAKLDKQAEEIEALKKRQAEIDESWKKKIASVERRWQTKYNSLKKQFEAYKKKHS